MQLVFIDLPEVSLVAILDADKEGYLRSKEALIQTMGRAALLLRRIIELRRDGEILSPLTGLE